jgi:hypothetical protein
VEFYLNGLPDNAVYISGFRGENGRIVELNAVSLVYIVFSYGRLVRMLSKSWKPLIGSIKLSGHDPRTLGDAVPHS